MFKTILSFSQLRSVAAQALRKGDREIHMAAVGLMMGNGKGDEDDVIEVEAAAMEWGA